MSQEKTYRFLQTKQGLIFRCKAYRLELMQDNIPVTLICDNMAGHFMKEGLIDCVIVGADRIALNGDTANKIELIPLLFCKGKQYSVLCCRSTTTIDFSIETGEQIPIEERSPAEITHIKGIRIAPKV